MKIQDVQHRTDLELITLPMTVKGILKSIGSRSSKNRKALFVKLVGGVTTEVYAFSGYYKDDPDTTLEVILQLPEDY